MKSEKSIIRALRKRLLDKYEIKVVKTEHNPNMESFEGVHFRVKIKNIHSGVPAIFYFSVGSGHPLGKSEHKGRYLSIRSLNDSGNLLRLSADRQQKIFFALVESLETDRFYNDMEELIEGLGYSYKEAKRVFHAVEVNNEKCESILLFDFLDGLTDTEKEIIQEGGLSY